jgi:capsular exopolysaccharide synthesis family protein
MKLAATSDQAAPDRSAGNALLSDEEQARRIRRLLAMAMRRRGFVAVVTTAIFLIASLAIVLMPREYTAEASLAVDPRKTDIVNIAAVISNIPADIEGIATEVQVLQSTSLASRVLAKLSEQSTQPRTQPRKEASKGIISSMMEPAWAMAADFRKAIWGVEPASTSPEIEDADNRIKQFLGRLTVAQQLHSRVIKISYRSKDPGEAAKIVNTLADLYFEDQVTVKKAATEEAHRWINERLGGLRQEMRDAEQAVNDFRAEHHLVTGRGDLRPAEQQLTDLSARLVQIRARRAQIDAQLREIERLTAAKADSAAINGVLQSVTISRLREQETQVARELTQIQEIYGPKSPKLQALAAGFADTQHKIRLEISRIVTEIRSQAAQAAREEDSIASAISDTEARLGAESDAGVKLRELEQQAAAQRQVLITFIGRSKETGAEASYQAPDGRVVSYATVPTEPSQPKIPLFFYLAFAVALSTAICLAFVRELLDDRIRSGEHILALGAASLGMMPIIPHRRRPVHEYLAEQPFSALGESIRGLVTSLFIRCNGANVISVTSSLPGEGKTTVVAAIARLVAITGRRVLVIDCDMHRPRLHRELGMTEQPGLAEVLAGNLASAEAVIHDTATGIDLMPAGKDRKTDLLSTARLRDLIDGVRSLYDLVVIDSGPVLAVSDARVISQFADTTVFVARWAETRKLHAAAGLQQLHEVRCNIAGVFLTMVNIKRHSRYAFSDSAADPRLQKYYLQ